MKTDLWKQVTYGALATALAFAFALALAPSDYAHATDEYYATYCKNGTTLTQDEVKSLRAAGKIKISISINASARTATATIINDTKCGFPVSFASYQMYDQKLSTQKLFDTSKLTVPANSTKTLTVDLPSCMAQADLYYGNAPAVLYDDNRYASRTLEWAFYLNNGSGYSNASGQFCVKPLTISCSANPSVVDPGETVTYTANPSGGNGTYVYSWTGTDSLTGSTKSVSKSYSTAGSKTATVTVTSDGQSKVASCSAVVNEIIPDLAVSCSANPSVVDPGETVTYTANPSGGNGTYSYSWTGTNSLSGTTKSVSKSYSTAGSKTATVTVTSGGKTKTVSCGSVVEQGPDFALSCSVSKSTIDTGETVTYTANPSGGNGTYVYSWTGTDSLTGSTKSVSKSYSTAGSKTATVTVTSDGQSKVASCYVTVDEDEIPLGGSCTASKPVVDINEQVTFTAQGTGGTGNYTYQWEGDSSGIFFDSTWNQNGGTLTGHYDTPGNKNIQVRINSGNTYVLRTCSVVVEEEEEDLNAFCEGIPSRPDIDERVTWTAYPSGGDGDYDYDWSGTDSLDGDDKSITKRYDDDGTKTATVRVTSNGKTVTRSCSIRVDDDDDDDDNLEVSCRVSPRNPEVDERVTWTADADGGDGDYDYDWSGDDGLDGDNRTVTHRYDDEGEYDARIRVTDGDGNTASARCRVEVEDDDEDDDNDVAVYTNPGDTNYASAVYLSQIPYTGAMDNWKISLYVLGFLLWSGVVSYYILKKKYGIENPIAFAAEKVGFAAEDLSKKLANLRVLDKMRSDRDERFRKLWDRVNNE